MKEPTFGHSSLFPSEADLAMDASGALAGRTKTKRHLGAILVDAGVISKDDALRVLDLQRKKKLRFGEAAIMLGLISEADIRYALSYQYEYAYLPRNSGQITSQELIAAYMPFCKEVDQIREIRSQLKLRWFDHTDRAVLTVIGAGRAEGGSYLAANLAIVFAQMGESTLLIDADMHHPKQHTLFQLNNQQGFSSLLAGRSAVASALHHINFMPQLDVITAGPIPPNPQELLNRANLGELLDWAGKTYDIVLLDTASLAVGADAVMLAAKAGAAMVVARANETKVSAFHAMVNELQLSNVNVVGAVLNDPPLIDIGG